MTEDWRDGGFGLYLHWPFCQSKCPYCDFNSHVAATIDQARWQRAYLVEIERVGAETHGRVLDTVFFGGGTPSLMNPELVGAVLEKVRATWPTSNSFEVTLEANPTSVEAGRFRGYRAAGVNRVSIGIQALNDADLRALGRLHSVAEALSAFDLARDVFDRVSFDLIYARQHQTVEAWQSELRQALALGADHLSLYQLSIEEGTAFGDRFTKGRLPGLPVEDSAADMYFVTQEICEVAGLPSYEISNHARHGAESRHNLIYWNNGDYAGIGPGAHGRLTLAGRRWATDTPKPPGQWLQMVEADASGEFEREPLNTPDQAMEYLMMGLRLRDGILMSRLGRFEVPEDLLREIKYLIELGMLDMSDGRLLATPRGRPVLNAVLGQLYSAFS